MKINETAENWNISLKKIMEWNIKQIMDLFSNKTHTITEIYMYTSIIVCDLFQIYEVKNNICMLELRNLE